jgi:hypothetical protein
MNQPATRFHPSAVRHLFSGLTLMASRLGSFVDTVLRGLDRIFGGLARPALQPVPARVPSSGSRRRG